MPEVTSGSVLGNIVGDGSNERSYLNWQLALQSVEGNYSDINWQMGWDFDNLSCRGLRNGKGLINSSYVYFNTNAGDAVHAFNGGHNHVPGLQIASGSVRLNHGPAGTCTFGAFVTLTGYNNQKSENSDTFQLPTIARVSDPPSMPVVTNITQVTATVTFTDGEGGGPIDSRQIRYGEDPDGIDVDIIPSTGSNTLLDLLPGITYYIWARTHNAAGYSEWSSRTTMQTIAGSWVKDDIWYLSVPYTKDSGVWKLARPWVNNLGEWKESQ